MGLDLRELLKQYEAAPVQEPMHGKSGEIRRAPSTDQKRVRRELNRRTAVDNEQTESHAAKVARLLTEARHAPSLAEQRRLVGEAEQTRFDARQAAAEEKAYTLAGAVVRDTLVPGTVHEKLSASSDFLLEMDLSSPDRTQTNQKMLAEASLWFGRVSDDVKTHENEYFEQARGLGHRLASSAGEWAAEAERTFLDEANRLLTLSIQSGQITPLIDNYGIDPEYMPVTAASSLPQVAQDTVPQDMFSNLVPESYLTPSETASTRAPAIQELAEGDQGWQGHSVVPEGDSGAAAMNNDGPTEDHARPAAGFPVSGSLNKESSMDEHYAQCPACAGMGKVAARTLSPREANSGLPQIDQIVDVDNNNAPTEYPAEVAFGLDTGGWGGNAIPSAINQAEQQIAERNKKSPLLNSSAAQHTAAEQDASGWIGDMGGKGRYDGYSAPAYDGSSNLGQPDPVYGYGGDNPNQPLTPHAESEADDYTNDPGQDWRPGQPLQDDWGQSSVSPTMSTGANGVS